MHELTKSSRHSSGSGGSGRSARASVSSKSAASFPRDLYKQMGELGLFGCCFPESMGGTGAGYAALATVAEQLAWVYPPLSAAMNLQAATVPLTIANWGSPELVGHYVPALLAGQLLGSNAMTEPDGGSDFLGAMRTRAVPDGADWLITGSKMWITNANVADVAIVYAKTDPAAGHKGVTAFVVPTSTRRLQYAPGAVPGAGQADAHERGAPGRRRACRPTTSSARSAAASSSR